MELYGCNRKSIPGEYHREALRSLERRGAWLGGGRGVVLREGGACALRSALWAGGGAAVVLVVAGPGAGPGAGRRDLLGYKMLIFI